MKDPVLLVALPLITAFLVPIFARFSTLAGRWIGPLSLLTTGLLSLSLFNAAAGEPLVIALGGFRPPLGITLYADQLALLFTLCVSFGVLLLWPRYSDTNIRERTLTLVLAAAGNGLALSGDLFNLYVFYELVAVVSYGLIAANNRAGSFAAALRYLIVSAFGAALALTGIALIYQATGTLNLAHLAQLAPEQLDNSLGLMAFVLLLIGFGVKAELFPVNTWVPEVYATAPNRLSGLLAGVISKLALLVILRILVLLFNQPEALMILLALGIAGVISGELAAFRARDFNRMLAFSSIGQLGIVFIAFSMPGDAALLAGLAVALHHVVVKPALFLLAERWNGSLARLTGIAGHSPLAAALFILLALSLIGVPPLPGFWAKLLVLMELANQAQGIYYLGAAAILSGAALEANYLFRIVSGFYSSDTHEATPAAHRLSDLAAASMLALVLLASVFLLAPIAERLGQTASQAANVDLYVQSVQPGLAR